VGGVDVSVVEESIYGLPSDALERGLKKVEV